MSGSVCTSFACGMCGKCYKTAGECVDHIQTHTSQQPFRCLVCWPLFTDSGDAENTQGDGQMQDMMGIQSQPHNNIQHAVAGAGHRDAHLHCMETSDSILAIHTDTADRSVSSNIEMEDRQGSLPASHTAVGSGDTAAYPASLVARDELSSFPQSPARQDWEPTCSQSPIHLDKQPQSPGSALWAGQQTTLQSSIAEHTEHQRSLPRLSKLQDQLRAVPQATVEQRTEQTTPSQSPEDHYQSSGNHNQRLETETGAVLDTEPQTLSVTARDVSSLQHGRDLCASSPVRGVGKATPVRRRGKRRGRKGQPRRVGCDQDTNVECEPLLDATTQHSSQGGKEQRDDHDTTGGVVSQPQSAVVAGHGDSGAGVEVSKASDPRMTSELCDANDGTSHSQTDVWSEPVVTSEHYSEPLITSEHCNQDDRVGEFQSTVATGPLDSDLEYIQVKPALSLASVMSEDDDNDGDSQVVSPVLSSCEADDASVHFDGTVGYLQSTLSCEANDGEGWVSQIQPASPPEETSLLSSSSSGCNVIEMSDSGSVDEVPCTDSSRLVIQVETKSTGPNFSNVIQFLKSVSLKPGSPTKTDMLAIGLDTISDGSSKSASDMDSVSHWDQESDPLKSPAGDAATKKSTCIVTQGVQTDYDNKNSGSQNKRSVTVYRGDSCVVRKVGGQVTKSLITGASVQPRSLVITTPTCATSAPLLPASCSHQTGFSTAGVTGQLAPPSTLRSVSVASPTSTPRVVEVLCVPAYTLSPYQDHTLYHPVMRKEGSTTVSLLRGRGTGDKASTVTAGSDEASKVAAVDDEALEVTSVEALSPTAANTPLPGGDTNNSTSDPHVTVTTAVSSAGSNQCVSVSQSSDTDQAQVSIIVQGLGDCGHQDFIQSACLDSGVTCNQKSGECGHQDGHQDCAASDVKVCVEGGSQQHVECGHEATLSLEDLANVCAWIQRVNTEQGTLDWQTEFVEKSASSTLSGQPAGASWAIGDHDYAVLAQVADVTSQPENPVGKLTVKSSKQNDADSEKGCIENSTSKVIRQSSMQGGADPEKGHIVNPAGKVNRQTSVQSEADPEKEHMLSCVDLYHKKKLSERKTTPSATVARTRLQLKMNQSSADEASPKNTKRQRRRKVHSSVRKRTLRSSVGADSVLLPTEDAMNSANVLPSKTVVSDTDHEPEPQDTSSSTTVTKMLSIVLSDISAGHSREIAPCRNQSLSRVSVTTQSPTKLRECSVTLRPIQQHECSVTQSSIQGPAPAVTDSPTQNQDLTAAKSPTRSYDMVAASPINHDNQIVMQSPAQFCDHNGGVDKTGHVDLHSAGDDRKLPAADTEPACADGVKMPTAVVLGEEEQREHDGGELLPDSGDDGPAVVMLTNVQSGDAGLPGLMLISTQDSVAPPTTDMTVTPPSTRGQTRHIATVTHTATRHSRVTPGVRSSKKGLQDEASPSRTRARRRVGVPMTIRGRAYMKGRSPLKRNQTVSDGVSRSRGLGMSGETFYIAKGRLRASTLFTHPQYYRRRTTADSKQDRATSVPSTPASGTARDGAAGPQQDNGAALMVTVADVHSGLENQGGTALDSHGDQTAPVSALYIKSSPGNVPPADEASRNLGSTPVVSRKHLGSTPVESKLQIRLALIERGLGSMKRQRASTAGRKVADRQESKRVRCSLPTASVENRPTLRHRSATRTSPQQPSDSLRSSKNIRAGEMEQAVDISVLSEISQANDALQQSKDSAVKRAPDGGMLYKKNFSPLETSSDAIILPDDGRIHECTECTARFSNKLRLMSHMAIHESGLSNFTCDICFRTFTRQYSVKIHRMIHTREAKVDCEVCGRTLANPGNLAIHMRIHTDERPFACDLCPKTFRQQAALQSHIRTHSKERPFACEYCDKRYAFQKNLYTHRFSHTGQRPYACKLCGAAFRQMSALKVHLRAHTGEKPFKCPQCSSRFTQKSHLKKHLRHLHQPRVSEEERLAKDRLKPHRCKHCEKGFSSPFSLKRHLTEGYCTQASNFVNRRKFPYRSVL